MGDIIPRTYEDTTGGIPIDKMWLENVYKHGDPTSQGMKEENGELVEIPVPENAKGPKVALRMAVTKRVRKQGAPLREAGAIAREFINNTCPDLSD